MRYKLISCEIFFREICAAAARSEHVLDIEFLPKGLHDLGQEKMLRYLEDVLSTVDESCYEAILLGYGLCNNGVAGLRAKTIPLVIPRAHDCITLFLGSKERYLDYFNKHPGVYYFTTGWLERGEDTSEIHTQSIQHIQGLDMTYEELVEKYGKENADYLYKELGDLTRNYTGATFIEMGIERNDRFEQRTKEIASEQGWTFQKIQGDMGLIQRFLDGDWNDEDFLIVPPGHQIKPKHDGQIMTLEVID